MDYMVDQVVTPIAAAVSDVVLLLEQINQTSGIYNAIIDLANAFFFFLILVNKDHQKQFAKLGIHLQGPPPGHISNSVLYPYLVCRVTFPFHKTSHCSVTLMTFC